MGAVWQMLKRQLVAFAMDAWARQETELRSIPGKTTLILSEEGAQKFPGRFLAFYSEREHELTDAFFQVFGAQICESNQQRLREFAGTRNIRELVTGAFDRIREEREELRLIQRRTRERKQKLAQDPEAFENPKDEGRLLDDSERLVARLMAELGQKYPLNVLTDAGVLPNYAFPEPGVMLKATLHTRSSGEGERDQYEQRDYIRPASSAIRELAPGNTFYADGHKLRIKELDLGSRAQPLHVSWRMCANCHHSGMELPTGPVASECPRCGDPTWSDEGQLRKVVKLQRVRSLMTKLEAAIGDDGDDREEAHYQVEDLIDVAPCHRFGARIVADLPFGIELLKELPLREFNFGALNGRGNGAPSLQVAGRPVTPEGFVTCVDCGRVREDDKPEIQHTSWCPGRRLATAANTRESLETVFLYREVRSEAIRVLLPAAEIDKDRRILSFKAALELGFRRRFAGDPRHLQIRLYDEPVGVQGRMRFLVIFDTVPGGTGYLSELWHGDHFRDVLKLAHTTLEQCSCQRRDPPANGCYQCLYAYQSQRHLKDLSSLEARGMLQEILQAWPRMEKRTTLSDASLASRLESELERFFLQELEAWAKATGKKWQEGVRSGKEFWTLTTGSRTWEIHPQVELGSRDGVLIQCRPDFVIKPADGHISILPIAVFCDGLEYHVRPNQESSRLADDVQKRSSVLHSSSYRVWSVTWKDVEEFRDRRTETKAPLLFERLDARKLTVLFERCGKPLVRDIGTRPSMYMLLDYMENPDRDSWQRAALATSLAWLAAGPFVTPADVARVEQHLSADPTSASAATSTAAPQGVAMLAKLLDVGGLQILGSCPSASINSPAEWHSLRLTLRLSDDADARKQPQFEGTWRALLQAWNLLQFHHGVSILTTDLVRDSQLPSLPTLQRTDRAPQPSIAADAEDPALTLQPLLDAQIFALVRSIVDRGAPLPQVGYELLVDTRVAAEAELAWPDHHVALLLEHQSEGTEAFQRAGWTVVDADEARLAAALRLKPS
jgi:DEAD/DEAH box helicase domain-containing protein